jgi:hypothetical protein
MPSNLVRVTQRNRRTVGYPVLYFLEPSLTEPVLHMLLSNTLLKPMSRQILIYSTQL